MWDSLLCLLPSLLLLLVAALLRWSPASSLLERGSRRATWILWRGVCWVLELPIPTRGEWTDGRSDTGDAEPSLVCKPTALAHHLLLHCRTLLRPSLAAWPQGDPHLQTLSSLLWPLDGSAGGKVRFTRDHLLLNDGGTVALDWAVGLRGEPLLGAKCEQQLGVCRSPGCRSCSSPPILLLIPNSLGTVTPHLQRLCSLGLCRGYYPVVFHRRGQGGCPLTTPRYQEFGDPRDLVQAVAYLRARHRSAMLLAVSEGSGSGLLLSYLGECGSSSYLTAAACISPVLHGRLWFETPVPSLYHWGALFYHKLQISRYASALSSLMDVGQLLRCRSLKDMEELMFCGTPKPTAVSAEGQSPADGAKGWEAYWERNEPLRDADEVAVPVLCLCSADDPLLPPASTLPTSLFHNSPYFLLALTACGGHCGFFAQAGTGGGGGGGSGSGGTGTVASWSHEAVLEYFRVASDFLKGEEKRRRSRLAQEQDVGGQVQGWRRRSSTVLARRSKPVLPVRRERHLTHQPAQTALAEDLFTWNRSYTR
ncbi:protein ABHD15 [Alosa sapidissima]|uniref:protein ABHD15 n=1 Tax=Alosa sapidissima TaxID=34773 RepID=UPI001C0A64A8|nr:protein ABHD15 [Alosa sapidissima]